MTLTTDSEARTIELGRLLAPLLEAGDVVSLTGDLGAGKTQLVKGVAAGLGVCEPVVSPTFNILLVHPGRLPLYHFDLYRLDDEAQLEDVDFYGMLEADAASFVEWGERFPHALPDDHLAVSLCITGDETRTIELLPGGPRARELAVAWESAARADGGAV